MIEAVTQLEIQESNLRVVNFKKSYDWELMTDEAFINLMKQHPHLQGDGYGSGVAGLTKGTIALIKGEDEIVRQQSFLCRKDRNKIAARWERELANLNGLYYIKITYNEQ